VQSALSPAGREAEQIAQLFWWMAGAAAVIWTAVICLGAYALRVGTGENDRRSAMLIVWGGAVIPTVILAVLLCVALPILADLLAPAPEGSLKVRVVGHQWWWRVFYESADGDEIELANEIRLPVDQPVEFELQSGDVIHSFWIPSLGGKMDMIPGRTTRLRLQPTRTGEFRGACAEYCGTSHALMAFPVVVHEEPDFQAWLERQSQPAQEPVGSQASEGRELFLSSGCGACHAVRGTPADGRVGPDLTHVGSRLSIAAGTLNADREAFVRWLKQTHTVKPDALMPPFGAMPNGDLQDIAAYLDGLE
jgi:cytochrome c oxidase subunit 2